MKSSHFLFLFSVLTGGTGARGVTPDCRPDSLWRDDYTAKLIFKEDTEACSALCTLLEKVTEPIFCEHDTGGRGYERSFVGNYLRGEALGCLRYWPQYGSRYSNTTQDCYVRERKTKP